VGLGLPAPQRHLAGFEEYIARELSHLSAETRKKIVCDNAAKPYRFVN
jgi:hypothetical protein